MVVYKVTNKNNGKVYIGRCVNLNIRWKDHQRDALKRQSQLVFHRAIRKYGVEAFTIEVIYHANTVDELSKMEIFFIILYQSHKSKNGYNMTLGGDGAGFGNLNAQGSRHSDEWKLNMGKMMLGNTNAMGSKHTDDWKKAAKLRMLGKRYSAKPRSEETKQRISGRKRSAKQKLNMSISQHRRMSTPEGRELAKRMAAARWSK